MKTAPRHNPANPARLTEEYYGELEAVVIRHAGGTPGEAQRVVNAVLRQAKIGPPGKGPVFVPQALARLDEARYAEMEATVIRRTGLGAALARELVDGLLGPLLITPPMEDGLDYDEEQGCHHVYYGFDGQFTQCVMDHEEPGAAQTLHGSVHPKALWNSGDRRDIDAKELQW